MSYKNKSHTVKSIVSRIDRIIRVHRTVAIGFVAALFIILMPLCTKGTTADKSTYFVKTEGSCHQPTSIKIIDESGGQSLAGRSMTNSAVSPFKNYVNIISKYAFAKIDEMGQCKGDLNSDPQVELSFVYRPMLSLGIAPFNFEPTKSNDTRQLDSPWVKLTIGKSPKLIVRAAFIWNERQFLLDQALLSDARYAPTTPPLPIDRRIYGQFFKEYEEFLLAPSLSAKNTAKTNLFKQVPADILWLFRYAPQDTSTPFGIFLALDKTIKKGTEQYIDLTKALLNSHFSSVQTDRRYESVLDLKDVFNIDTYQINPLH
jgi:hypothetical protein